jgi:uncharacterized pyridoxamine 5'-phosphate oxidase family protein
LESNVTIREFEDFAAIEPAFRERVDQMVWCAVATVDTHGRPSTRLLHPMWEGSVGWILTYRDSPKRLHLAQNPHVSLAYVSDVVHPVYIDAIAAWEEDPEVRQRVWDMFKSTPEPLGYDPEPMFVAPDHENTGLLRIEPWKITLATLAGDPWQQVWRRKKD